MEENLRGRFLVAGWEKEMRQKGERLLGRGPNWSKQLNIPFIVLFFAIGMWNFGFLLAVLLKT